MKARIGGAIIFLLKLPFRVAALPVVLALALIQFLTALITCLSSIIINLIGTLGIATAACIWMFHLGTDADAYRILGQGIFFIVLPHAAGWIVSKAADVCARLIAFIIP